MTRTLTARIDPTTIRRDGINRWRVASQSQPGHEYLVVRFNGALTCDCKAGFYRGTCKHSRAVEDLVFAQAQRTESARELGRTRGAALLLGK